MDLKQALRNSTNNILHRVRMRFVQRGHRSIMLLMLSVVLLFVSCSQYDYTSPLPGILEFRLKTKNSRTSLMPFGQSSFVFNLKSLEAVRAGGARLDVLPDLNAIRRPTNGDSYNALDTLARDSAIILGRAYAPPGEYVGINLVATIENNIVIVPRASGIPSFIQVAPPPYIVPALKQLPRPGESLSIKVAENRLTRVNVMLDLDSTLIRRAEYFEGALQFYISSIQNF